MKNKNRQSGFTLMEVMFAVAILAIGLIFLACQFPVGMFASRDVVDASRSLIEVHNSQVMLEVRQGMVNQSNSLDTRGNGYLIDWPAKDLSKVHLLIKPNVLADSLYTDTPRLILDDLEDFSDYIVATNDPAESDYPDYPFWSYRYNGDLANPDTFPMMTPDPPLWPLGLGDIGHMMSPPVDESNSEVQKLLRQAGVSHYDDDLDDYIDELNLAIFEVSLEGRYSWAAMYSEGSSQYYIFTFRRPRTEVRYAMQAPGSFAMDITDQGEPYNNPPDLPWPMEPSDSEWDPLGFYGDRVFPVPWRVCLPPEFWYRYNWDGKNHVLINHISRPAAFAVPADIAAILQPGSIIIDGDPPDRHYVNPYATPPTRINKKPRTTTGSGNVYEVLEILAPGTWETNDDTREYYELSQLFPDTYLVRLRTRLRDHLHYFWVFPPAVTRDEAGNFMEYEDWQPVVSVTKRLIDFD